MGVGSSVADDSKDTLSSQMDNIRVNRKRDNFDDIDPNPNKSVMIVNWMVAGMMKAITAI